LNDMPREESKGFQDRASNTCNNKENIQVSQ
jgi:hypothetical protein